MGERYVVRDGQAIGLTRRDAAGEFAAVYVERAAAEADAADRNRTWRRKQVTDPYLFSGNDPTYLTSLPEPVFRDWLLDHDIRLPGPVVPPPPFADTRPRLRRWLDGPLPSPEEPPGEWDNWWRLLDGGRQLTPAQRDQLADVLDKLVRYDVFAVPTDDDAAGQTVFVVYEDDWGMVDRVPWHTDPVKAFRTRAAAEAERDRRRAETGRRHAVVETTLDGRG